MKAIKILGVGAYAPETVITNDDLSKLVDTSDEWIYSRTGIKKRHVVSGNETAADLAAKAAKDALDFAGVSADEIDFIIVGTSLPDNLYPSTACEVQREIGATKAFAFDLVAACSGFVYSLSTAAMFLRAGGYKRALVIGVDIHSRFIDWTDRGTCVLFGDGAGAFVVESSDDEAENELLGMDLNADGSKGRELTIPLTGKNCPLAEPNDIKPSFVNMNGREIFKFAVSEVPKSVEKVVKSAGLTMEQLDFVVPHQANTRIVQAISDRMNYPIEKFILNIEEYGNTSTASIPMAFCEAVKENKVPKGSHIVLTGFGGGLTWASALIKWNAVDKRK